MQFQILEADLENEGHRAGLVHVLDAYAAGLDHGQSLSQDVRKRLVPALIQHPTTFVLLAFDGQQAVGTAVCFIGFSTFQARGLLNIHDLAVLPSHRGKGIGRALLRAAENYARQRGYCKLTLEVQDTNQRARKLYESVGFGDFVVNGSVTRFLCKPLD